MRIACFSIVRNEVDIIEDWLRHAVYMFGSGNVFVLDDQSDDGTGDILRQYSHHVESRIVASNSSGPRKGELLTELMQAHRPKYDLLIPLDADEFIGTQECLARSTVWSIFTQLQPALHGRFKFPFCYQAIPSSLSGPGGPRFTTDFTVMTYEFFGREHKGFAKTFFASGSFLSTDDGNHQGASENPSVMSTCLWLYHYPARSLDQFRKKTLRGAAYANGWVNYSKDRHWRKAHDALQAARLEEHYLKTFANLQPYRRAPRVADHFDALASGAGAGAGEGSTNRPA